MGWNPIKAVKKGIKHAVKQGKKEVKKINPKKPIEKGIDHAVKQIKKELEKEYKKKYNHIVHHCYDILIDEIKSNYDPFVSSLSKSKSWEKTCASVLLKKFRLNIFKMLRGDIRKKVMKKLEK